MNEFSLINPKGFSDIIMKKNIFRKFLALDTQWLAQGTLWRALSLLQDFLDRDTQWLAQGTLWRALSRLQHFQVFSCKNTIYTRIFRLNLMKNPK